MKRLLLTTLALCACGNSSSASDASPSDAPPSDAPPADARADRSREGTTEARPDLSPDGPRPPAHWHTVPGASLDRLGHSVTALLDGGVLIVGGYTYDSNNNALYYAKAYRYDPVSDTVAAAGELKQARSGHSATRLADGRVLVVGGADESAFLTSSEIFDPTKPPSTAWSPGPDLLEVRPDHSALLLPSGEVMVIGGGIGSVQLKTILLYSPATNAWKLSLITLKQARCAHQATLLQNGKLLVSGGHYGKMPVTYLDDLEVIDLKTGSTTQLPAKMSKPRAYHSASLLDDGRVLIVGGTCDTCAGSDFDDLYDPKTDALTPVPHPGGGVIAHMAARLLGNRVLVAGTGYGTSAQVVAFDPGALAWDILPLMAEDHVGGRACALSDGTVLVTGGYQSIYPTVIYSNLVERFHP